MLIPFLPIRFRRHIPSDRKMQSAKSPDKRHDLEKKVQKSKEELTSFLQETILILDQESAEGFLTETDKKLILMLLQKSMLRISYRNRNLCQEVYNMTEPVLKLPTDELFEVIHERDALKRGNDGRTVAGHIVFSPRFDRPSPALLKLFKAPGMKHFLQ